MMTEKPALDGLIERIRRLAKTRAEHEQIASTLQALDERYELAQKLAREPGLNDIILQLMGRIYQAYGDFNAVKGKRVLDIACGSNTSSYPASVFVDTPSGERSIPASGPKGYTVQFEPWFCRILLELGAWPVGIDIGDLDGERFEHYRADLGQPGALDFLPDRSFDAVQDSRLFGSPEFTAQFPNPADRLRVAAVIWRQELRLLKPDGVVIHSDAEELMRRGSFTP
jgi:hypothetical protein